MVHAGPAHIAMVLLARLRVHGLLHMSTTAAIQDFFRIPIARLRVSQHRYLT